MSDKVETRNRTVLEAALALAEAHGMGAVTRPRVAEAASVAVGTVSNVHGSMDGLRGAVMALAVEREILPVVAQGLAERYPEAIAATPELKTRALAAIAAAA